MTAEWVQAAQAAPRRTSNRSQPRERSATVARAITAARELAWAGQHASAIDIVTAALAAPGSDEASRLALLELRGESLSAQGEVDGALVDAKAMLAIAAGSGRPDLQAQALNCL